MEIKQIPDNNLVKKVQKKRCEQSLSTLINKHEKLYFKICQKYIPQGKEDYVLSLEDSVGNKESIIYECILSFNPDKGAKFSTWLGNFVRYKCLNYLNKQSRYVNIEEEGLAHIFNKRSIEDYDGGRVQNEFDYIIFLINQFKDKRIQKVFKLRYLSGQKKMTWVNIGKTMKISAQTAINLHNKGRVALKKKANNNKLHLADKIL